MPGNEAADKAAKEVAEHYLEEQEPETLRTLMATTRSIIRRTMKVEWKVSWEKAKQVAVNTSPSPNANAVKESANTPHPSQVSRIYNPIMATTATILPTTAGNDAANARAPLSSSPPSPPLCSPSPYPSSVTSKLGPSP